MSPYTPGVRNSEMEEQCSRNLKFGVKVQCVILDAIQMSKSNMTSIHCCKSLLSA